MWCLHDAFAKTGSGQAEGKLTNKTGAVVCLLLLSSRRRFGRLKSLAPTVK
eukprot:COSAG06_NODE_45647_length_353_cov_0.677165_1_plen_50_part_01